MGAVWPVSSILYDRRISLLTSERVHGVAWFQAYVTMMGMVVGLGLRKSAMEILALSSFCYFTEDAFSGSDDRV